MYIRILAVRMHYIYIVIKLFFWNLLSPFAIVRTLGWHHIIKDLASSIHL